MGWAQNGCHDSLGGVGDHCNKKKTIAISPNEEVPSYMKRIIGALQETDAEDEDLKEHLFFHRHEPKEVLVVPSGFATIERT